MTKHQAIVAYYLPVTGQRMIAEHEAGSDALWRLLNDLITRNIRFSVTFRTVNEGDINAQNA